MRIIPLIALAIALAPGGQADRIDEYVRSQLKSRHLPGVSFVMQSRREHWRRRWTRSRDENRRRCFSVLHGFP